MNNTIKLIQVEQVQKDIKVFWKEVKENIQNIKASIPFVMVFIRNIYKFIYNNMILIILRFIKFIIKKMFKSNIAVLPWWSLKDILDTENMTTKELSLRSWIKENYIKDIINGKENITPEIALRLEKVFWISSDYWNNLQKAYEKDLLRLKK